VRPSESITEAEKRASMAAYGDRRPRPAGDRVELGVAGQDNPGLERPGVCESSRLP
jgi:hypothetical protein